MQDGSLVQRRPNRPVQAVFQIHGVPPLHNMRKKVSEEGGVLGQQCAQIEGAFGSHQLIEPHLPGRYRCPVLGGYVSMVRVGASVANSFEDH